MDSGVRATLYERLSTSMEICHMHTHASICTVDSGKLEP